jgi:hypothetical protein
MSGIFCPALCTEGARDRKQFVESLPIVQDPLWQAAKTVGEETPKNLGREALRAGTNIVHDIAQNPNTVPTDIVGNHVSESTQNIVRKLRGVRDLIIEY